MPLFRLAMGLMLVVGASGPQPHRAAVPEKLRVPDSQPLLVSVAARGVQIYTCKAKVPPAAAFAWTLKAPEAELFDATGAKFGRHYAGPTWESADGSRVVGEVVQTAPVQGAVPWLLLRAKSNQGTGALSSVKFIQRLDTKGGVAPSAGCDAEHAGAEKRVAYSASYAFYGAP